MKPIHSVNFGAGNIIIRFHNGTSAVNGHIERQIGTKTFIVSDGDITKTVRLTDKLNVALTLDRQNGGDASVGELENAATIVATIDGERHYVKSIWSQLIVTITGIVAKWTVTDDLGEIPLNRISNIAPSIHPRIDGTFVVGETITLSHGVWNIVPETYEYIWYADDVIIPDQDGLTLELTSDMLGKRIKATVVVTYEGGTASATTPPSVVVAGDYAPVAFVPPAISGFPRMGNLLTANVGQWTNSPTEILIQWMRDGEPIVGETGTHYTPTEADIGAMLSINVIANNPPHGSGEADSLPIGPVPDSPAINLIAPVIIGVARVGQVLTVTDGTWSKPSSEYQFRWYINGVAVAGAFGKSFYITTSHPIGATIQASVVSVIGLEQSEPAFSQTVTVMPATQPVNITPPSFTGTLAKDNTLTVNVGTWSNNPDSYVVEWLIGTRKATGNTVSLSKTDEGKQVTVTVTARKYGAADASASSELSEPILISSPVNTTPPFLSGSIMVGRRLSVSSGVWINDPTSYQYQWYADGEAIPYATNSTFTLTESQTGKKITARVSAIKAGVLPVHAFSNESETIPTPSPVNTTLPVITGSPRIGETLSVDSGVWTYEPTSYTYQWLADGVAIAGATTRTLTLTDLNGGGRQISVRVNAVKANTVPTAVETLRTEIVPQLIPALITAPIIEIDVPELLAVATVTNGEWTNNPQEYSYQWLADGVPIVGADDPELTLTLAQEGKFISCRVTAKKIGAQTSVDVDGFTMPVVPPVNLTIPSISGTITAGNTINGSSGTWNVPVTLTYQWYIGDEPIAGATSTSMVINDTTHIGKQISFHVTGTKAGFDPIVVTSNPTIAVPDPIPVNTSAPTISGTAFVSYTLSVGTGNWTNNPTSYVYSWYADGVLIEGATTNTFVITEAQLGKRISASVMAIRGSLVGTAVNTQLTATVAQPIPVNTGVPTITGNIAIGEELTASTGVWTHSPTSYAYQWFVSDVAAAGETSNKLVIAPIHADKVVRVEVTAYKGVLVSSPARSANRSIILSSPVNVTPPTVTPSTPMVGDTVFANTGTWSNSPTGYTYQWLADDVEIVGATSSSFTTTAANYGQRLSVRVNAVLGSTTPIAVVSEKTDPVAEGLPTMVSAPVISGTFDVGQVVSCTEGEWESEPQSFSYQWYSNGTPISGATGSTFSITLAQFQTVLSCAVTANGEAISSTPVFSNNSPQVTNIPPSLVSAPVLSPLAVGETATVSSGVWGGGTPIDITYRWRWTGATSDASTTNSLAVLASNEGSQMTVTVTANKTVGGLSASTTVSGTTPWRVASNVTAPALTGSQIVGQTLTLSQGTWTPSPTSWRYEFFDDLGNLLQSSSSTRTFVIPESMEGRTISGYVTAVRGTTQTSTMLAGTTAVIPIAIPYNYSGISIYGTVQVGNSLLGSHGSWQWSPEYFTYEWLANDVPLEGKSGTVDTGTSNYLLLIDDPAYLGKRFKYRVTAHKTGVDPVVSTSNQTAVLATPPATNVTPPSILGSPIQGETLSVDVGTWSHTEVTYKYQWRANAVNISGATNATYVPTLTDVGKAITVIVYAMRGSVSSAGATSAGTAPVAGITPVNTELPVITGDPVVGNTLSVSSGVWTNTPTSYTYQWQRDGVNISGATSSTYVPTEDVIGGALRVSVNAVRAGTTPVAVLTAPTGQVTAAPEPEPDPE